MLRIAVALVLLAGLLAGAFRTREVGAQPAPEADILIRVHSCPDDFDGAGFFQHLTQCTSERGLYGVALGVQAGALGAPQFQYSEPDGTGRAALMVWDNISAGGITITEVAPAPIKPSVAYCSLQPDRGQLTMDGEEVPLDDGVMTISLDVGDTLMCDWYRWPGGVTAGDGGDGGDDDGGDDQDDDGDGGNDAGNGNGNDEGDDEGDDDGQAGGPAAGGGVTLDPETGEADQELTGGQIFVRAWDCAAGVQRPEVLDDDYAEGLAELTDACAPSEGSYPFSLGDVSEGDEALGDDQELAGEDADDAGNGGDVQGVVAEDGTVVDEEGGPDEAVAGGPTGEGDNGGGDDGGNQGIVDGDGAGVYEPIQAGGDTYRGWNGLAAGGYTILETVPEGYDQLVLCDGILAGTEAGANTFELTAIAGAVTYDLAEGERLLCDWFNRLADDGAGVGDGENNDRDRDGLLNTEEADYGTDPDDEDSDDDEVVDGDEVLFGTNPLYPDTDGDTFTDAEEMYQLGTDPLVYDLRALDDNDGDFLLNGEEVHEYGTDPFRSDSERDGLSDYAEVITYGSDPWDEDTDDDGYKDALEADAGTDLTVAEGRGIDRAAAGAKPDDRDGDGITDSIEAGIQGTDPDNPDTDGDGQNDGDEANAGTDPLDPND